MAWQGTVDKLAICKMYTRKNAQVVTDLQTSCNKVVVQIDIRMYSHCKSGTSCYHRVTRLMTVTDLQQVVPTRPLQAVRNKLLYEIVVINLLRADDIRLVGTTCCEFVGLIDLVTSRGAPDFEFSNPAGTGFTGFGQKFRPDLR